MTTTMESRGSQRVVLYSLTPAADNCNSFCITRGTQDRCHLDAESNNLMSAHSYFTATVPR